VKLADFGLSNDMVPGQLLKTICGSPAYSAPEIVAGKRYDGCAVDVWSCGVILYCMCVGRLPFDGANQPELFAKISAGCCAPPASAHRRHNHPTAGAYSIPDSVGHDCADLIRQFLVVDPSRRITISQAWHHPWLSSVNAGLLNHVEFASHNERKSFHSGAQICDFDDDDLNAEAAMLAGFGVSDGTPGGSAADPEFPGRIECCSSKCALPEELLAGALL
jgi:serine/threonine protein kinase